MVEPAAINTLRYYNEDSLSISLYLEPENASCMHADEPNRTGKALGCADQPQDTVSNRLKDRAAGLLNLVIHINTEQEAPSTPRRGSAACLATTRRQPAEP